MTLFGIEFSAAQAILLAAEVLILLLCIVILTKLARRMPVKKNVEQAATPAVAEAKGKAAQDPEEGELIAVITAAVAAAMGKDVKEIKVASCQEIRKREYTGRSAWSRAGRAEQLNRYI